jgi:septal ring factor EnvC (AmiA/AmiB activator)
VLSKAKQEQSQEIERLTKALSNLETENYNFKTRVDYLQKDVDQLKENYILEKLTLDILFRELKNRGLANIDRDTLNKYIEEKQTSS